MLKRLPLVRLQYKPSAVTNTVWRRDYPLPWLCLRVVSYKRTSFIQSVEMLSESQDVLLTKKGPTLQLALVSPSLLFVAPP